MEGTFPETQLKRMDILKKTYVALFCLTLLLMFPAVSPSFCSPGEAAGFDELDVFAKSDVDDVFISSMVIAEVSCGTDAYVYNNIGAPVVAYWHKGEKVEVIRGWRTLWYFCRVIGSEEKGWVPAECLDIPAEPEVSAMFPGAALLEEAAAEKGFRSRTDYFIWTDIHRQKVYIFHRHGPGAPWLFNRSFACATGKNVSPTTRGFFLVSERGLSFYNDYYESGAQYWVRFNGSYLFHSLPVDRDFNITDPTLGKRASSGCVRLDVDDARWIYEMIPEGTGVWVY